MTTTHRTCVTSARRLLTVPGLALAAAFAVELPGAAAYPAPLRCGSVVTGDVRLTADLLDCPGPGLVIGAAGVTIDLAGHTVDGSGSGAGIDNSGGHDNLTLRDGTVQEFIFGVELFETVGAHVDRVTARSNADGVKLARSQRVRLNAASAYDNWASGIEITFSDDVRVEGNTAADNVLGGIVDRFSERSRHERNNLRGNTAPGLTLDRTTRAVIEGNHAVHNASDGIQLIAVQDAWVAGNRAIANEGHGITADAPGNTLTHNVARDNHGFGIAVPAGTIDRGGNRASGNLAGDCTGVICR